MIKRKEELRYSPLTKIKILILGVFMYPIAMIGEWYETKTNWGYRPFSFIGTTAEYAAEYFGILFDYDLSAEGSKTNEKLKERKHIKRHQKRILKLYQSGHIGHSTYTMVTDMFNQAKKDHIRLRFRKCNQQVLVLSADAAPMWGGETYYFVIWLLEDAIKFVNEKGYKEINPAKLHHIPDVESLRQRDAFEYHAQPQDVSILMELLHTATRW